MKKILLGCFFVILLVGVFNLKTARADCASSGEQTVSIKVISCFYHDPVGENSLVKERVSQMSMTDEQKKDILKSYAGVIVSESGEYTAPCCISGECACLRPRIDYFYLTNDRNACSQFPKDQAVQVSVLKACCDGDPNPPCLMGFSNLIIDKTR